MVLYEHPAAAAAMTDSLKSADIMLSVKELSFSYKSLKHGHVQVLDGLNIDVRRGDFVSVLGPSGCGKSTFFSILSGKLPAGPGSQVFMPEECSFMPQKDLLLPWRTVIGNAILGADLSGDDLGAAKQETLRLIPTFGLSGFENYHPSDLSGGMRQRVALLRTAMLKRRFLVLDEPLGALDALTRGQMQRWLLEVKAELGLTVLMSTHDIAEATYLSDVVYVLSPRPAKVVARIEPAVSGRNEAARLIEKALGL